MDSLVIAPPILCGDDPPDRTLIIETRVERVHAHTGIVVPGTQHVDVTAWSPILYVFRHYFGEARRPGQTFRALPPAPANGAAAS